MRNDLRQRGGGLIDWCERSEFCFELILLDLRGAGASSPNPFSSGPGIHRPQRPSATNYLAGVGGTAGSLTLIDRSGHFLYPQRERSG